MLEHITPLILTYDEAPNIAKCLERLTWAKRIVVVDSLSRDATVEIARRFPNTEVFSRRFDVLATQWNFGLTETRIATEWVLGLDADYTVTDELVEEIKRLEPHADVSAYTASFRYGIYGRVLASGIYPPVKVLYRKNHCRYRQDGHAHRLHVERGKIETFHAKLVHDDWKAMERFLSSQSKYMDQEIEKLEEKKPGEWTLKDRLRKTYFLMPFLMFFYCLFFRRGILEGKPGIMYALQRMSAEIIFGLKSLERELLPRSREEVTRKAGNQ